MKALRNPVVAGAAVVVAIGVFIWTVLSPRQRGGAPNAGFATDLPAMETPAPTPPGEPAPPDEPTGQIELEQVRERFARWLEAPDRDPFQMALPKAPAGPPASELLKLAAIWRQTGGQFAIINGQVVAEGETIAGFKLERIEGDVIWVSGTNGMERVEFSHRGGPPSTEGAGGEPAATAATATAAGTASPPTG